METADTEGDGQSALGDLSDSNGPLSTVCSSTGLLSLIREMFRCLAVAQSRKFPADPESTRAGTERPGLSNK